MSNGVRLKKQVRALHLNLEGLMKLFGGTSEEKERFLEIVLGITTPAEYRIVGQQIETISNLVTEVRRSGETLKATAAETKTTG